KLYSLAKQLATPFYILNCHDAFPTLHSFPTRRSSDLAARAISFGLGSHQGLSGGPLSNNTWAPGGQLVAGNAVSDPSRKQGSTRSEEHTSELQSRFDLVCRLLLEKKNKISTPIYPRLG